MINEIRRATAPFCSPGLHFGIPGPPFGLPGPPFGLPNGVSEGRKEARNTQRKGGMKGGKEEQDWRNGPEGAQESWTGRNGKG